MSRIECPPIVLEIIIQMPMEFDKVSACYSVRSYPVVQLRCTKQRKNEKEMLYKDRLGTQARSNNVLLNALPTSESLVSST